MGNTETIENTAETPEETTPAETATYNTDEIFGVETISATEPTTVQTIPETTAYTGVTAEQFEKYQYNILVGTGYIIFILAMIFGALVGWGFSKIWRM